MPKEKPGWDFIRYSTGKPPTTGVYACRTPGKVDGPSFMMEDIFLIWTGKRWAYPCSDQYYRGEVVGWVGPLSRTLSRKKKPPKSVRHVTVEELKNLLDETDPNSSIILRRKTEGGTEMYKLNHTILLTDPVVLSISRIS